jgi:hypothetical protein
MNLIGLSILVVLVVGRKIIASVQPRVRLWVDALILMSRLPCYNRLAIGLVHELMSCFLTMS